MESPSEPEEGKREREGEKQRKPEQAGEQGDDGGNPEEEAVLVVAYAQIIHDFAQVRF
jgi:hypothetical protein